MTKGAPKHRDLGALWFTCATLAARNVPGLPHTKQGMNEFVNRAGWLSKPEGVAWRTRSGKGGGVEFSVYMLPIEAQAHLMLQEAAKDASAASAPSVCAPSYEQAWAVYQAASEKKRAVAARRVQALQVLEALCGNLSGKRAAMAIVALRFNVTVSTLYEWEKTVLGAPREHWLPLLLPCHAGAGLRAEIAPDAWDFIKSDWLRRERPTLRSCYRRLQAAAAAKGWQIPPERTLRRRLEALAPAVVTAERGGADELKKLFPAQERDRSVFHALEAVNTDFHTWDVFVRWPDGTIGRPSMIAFQDLYSGKILSWRVDVDPNMEAVRLAFGDVVEQFGIPDHCWMDNGHEFASKWITGGIRNRYRFKVRAEEPFGVMTQLGVKVHWTTPYSGQSKPIERAFRDFAHDTAKHPAFAGAYTGHHPGAKPANYGSSAVPLETFIATVGAAVIEHNARTGRLAAVCAGRSFDDVFAESYAVSPIRHAPAAMRDLWLMAAEGIMVSRKDGSLRLQGNRFWDERLLRHRGHRVVVRFDPAALQADVKVYDLTGRFICAAECIEAVGFADIEAARAHSRARQAWMRGARLQAQAEKRLSIGDVAAMLPGAQPPPTPAAKVVRVGRRTGTAPFPDEPIGIEGNLVRAWGRWGKTDPAPSVQAALADYTDEDLKIIEAVRSNAERLKRERAQAEGRDNDA